MRFFPGTYWLIALLAIGCGGDHGETKTIRKVQTLNADVPLTSRINGAVALVGTPPKPSRIMMDADPSCQKQHSMETYTNDYIVDVNGKLANVFVYIKNYSGPVPPAPIDTVILDQRGCEYTPHVFGLRAGQPLLILNSDPTMHNVHALPKINPQFNLAMPNEGMRLSRTFEKPEVMVKIKCDVHSWMSAYVGVLDHPYFAVSDPGGGFHIGPLPPGTYELEAWHEKLGTLTKTVTVGENQAVSVDLTFEIKPGS